MPAELGEDRAHRKRSCTRVAAANVEKGGDLALVGPRALVSGEARYHA